jgi:hypothetical protein
MKDLAVGYLKYKAFSDRTKALMSLKLLTENAVGIGDHSTGDFYKNLDEALDLLIDADDRIETLGKYFGGENANN